MSAAALPTDVTNPGLVQVANQAYPIVPPGFQQLSFDSKALLSASRFAPNPPPTPDPIFIPVASAVPVASQAYPRPLFSSLSFPVPPEVNVNAQSLVGLNTGDFIVTDAGNFQTNQSTQDTAVLVIATVTVIDSGSPNERLKIFFANENLFRFGVTLVGREAGFPEQAPVLAPENVPTRFITFFSTNFIIVQSQGLDAPDPGDTIEIDISREGPEAVFEYFDSAPVNVIVNLATGPLPSPPVNFQTGFFQGTSTPGSGVVQPTLGSGVPTGLAGGSFNVANQSIGLPPLGSGFGTGLAAGPLVEVEDQFIGEGLPENFFP